MKRKFVLLSGGALVGLAAAHTPLVAQEVRTEVSTSASVGYQSNPFLEAGRGNGGLSTTVDVDPRVVLEDENSLISITGGARFTYFPEDGRTNDSFSLNADVDQRTNERLTLTAGARFRTTRNALLDAVLANPDALGDDDTLPDPSIIDVTVAGEQFRTTNYGVNAGATLKVSPVSTLSGLVSANWSEFEGGFGNDFASTRAQLQYGRSLSETSTIGVVTSIAYTTFEGTGQSTNPFLALGGESTILDTRASYDATLSPTSRLSLQLGVSVVNFDLGAVGSDTNTIASGSISFCEEALGGSLCLTGSRTAQPTAVGGVSTLSSLSAGWSTRFTPRDTFSISARYAEVDVPDFSFQDLIPQQRNSRIFGVNSSYSRDIGGRFRLFVSGNYSEGSGGIGNLPANYGVRAGVSKTFGGSQ